MTTTPSDNALGTAYHDALARFVEHDQPPAVIRASSTPEGLLCPGSWRTGELRISPYSGEGALGSACHEVLARVVEQDMMILEALDIPATAQRWGVEVEELRILCAFGLQAYRQLRDVIEGAEVEAELVTELAPGTVLTGHIDVLKIDHEKGKAVFLDWKTGRVDRDYRAQLQSYALLVLACNPELKSCMGSIVWLREGDVESYGFDQADAAAFTQTLVKAVRWEDRTYRPGPHCAHCIRSHDCPAVVAMVKRDVAMLLPDDGGPTTIESVTLLPPEKVVDLYHKAKAVAAFCESALEAVRLRLRTDGPITTTPTRELRMIGVERREVDPVKAWPLLQPRLSDEEIAGCMKLSAAKLDDAVAKKAGKGKGAAAKRELGEALEKAGAVERVVIEQMREVTKKTEAAA